MSSTNMNEHSSRSHLLVSVYITSRNVITNAVSRGKLHMVDLAGQLSPSCLTHSE
jgi:kinesin family protein C2/C3